VQPCTISIRTENITKDIGWKPKNNRTKSRLQKYSNKRNVVNRRYDNRRYASNRQSSNNHSKYDQKKEAITEINTKENRGNGKH
jgi:hypothetical protein